MGRQGWQTYCSKSSEAFPPNNKVEEDFSSSRTVKDLQWHGTRCETVEGQMSHPADGKAWKHFNDKYNWFAKDAQNLIFSVATDGFNSFGNFSTTYNIWLVLVMPVNLPLWECVNPANCFMSLLIPGPKSPGKGFDVFLEPLIEELLQLWSGVMT